MNLSYEDMQFDPALLKFDKFCQAKSSTQQDFTRIVHYVGRFLKADWHMILLQLIWLQSMFFGVVAIIIRLV